MQKKLSTLLARIAAIVLILFGIAAVFLYQRGYYDLSFLPRQQQPEETHDPQETPIDLPDTVLPMPSDTDLAANDTENTNDSAKKDPDAAQTSLPTVADLTGAGYILQTDALVPGQDRLALVRTGGFGQSYYSSRGNVALSLYLGYLLYDNGSYTACLGADLHVAAAAVDSLHPVYFYDREHRPLFLYQGRYYALIDGTNQMIAVDTSMLQIPTLHYNFASDYAQSSLDLYPFSIEAGKVTYTDAEGNDVTEQINRAIENGYLTLDPDTLELTSNLSQTTIVVAPTVQNAITPTPQGSHGNPIFRPETEEVTEAEETTGKAEETDADGNLIVAEPGETDADGNLVSTEPDETDPGGNLIVTEPGETAPDGNLVSTEPGETDADGNFIIATPGETDAEGNLILPSLDETSETDAPASSDTTDPVPGTSESTIWELLGFPDPATVTAVRNDAILWGYRHADGTVAIEPRFLFAACFSENGYAAVMTEENHICFIDTEGTVRIDPGNQRIYLPGRDRRPARRQYAMPESFDRSAAGMFTFDHGWTRVRRIDTDYYSSRLVLNDENVLINTSGEEFPLPSGYTLVSYTDGILLLQKNGLYGFMDYTGKWIAQPVYSYAEPFSGGLAVVGMSKDGMLKGMIDRQGNEILPLAYDHIEGAVGGIVIAYAQESGWSVFNVMKPTDSAPESAITETADNVQP